MFETIYVAPMTTRLKQAVSGLIPERLRKVTASLRAGKKPERASEHNGSHELTVRLLEPARPAATYVGRLAVEILKREGRTSFKRLVADVAREVYFDEVRRGAWVLDIGLYGPDLFVAEVISELKAANGILWKIKSPEEPGNGALPDLS